MSRTRTAQVSCCTYISPILIGIQSAAPLHLACTLNNLEMVKFLISKGADVNAEDRNGEGCIIMLDERLQEVPSIVLSLVAVLRDTMLYRILPEGNGMRP